MTGMNCDAVVRRLDDYLDRELSPEEMGLVQVHLGVCAQCAREHRFEAHVIDAIRSKLSRLDVPASLSARIGQLLEQERNRSGSLG